MTPRTACFAIMALYVAGCGTENRELDRAIDLLEVTVGSSAVRQLPLAREVTRIRAVGDGLSADRTGPEGLTLDLRYQPLVPGRLNGSVEFLGPDDDVVGQLDITALARAPDVEFWPPRLVATEGPHWASVWVWPETDVQISGQNLPLCPSDISCLRALTGRADRGLGAQFQVRLGADSPSNLRLRTCDHPECEFVVPIERVSESELRCSPSPIEFPAAAVGYDTAITVRCEGGVFVPQLQHPELTWTRDSATDMTIHWQPQNAGPMTAELYVSADHPGIPIRGYAMPAPECRLQLEPEAHAYGNVAVGLRNAKVLRARNLGPSDCLLSGVAVRPPGPFSTPRLSPRWLAPAEFIEPLVTFVPITTGSFQAQAQFYVPSSSPTTIELTGQGVRATLEVLTETLDFGPVNDCGSRYRSIEVVNRGGSIGWVQGLSAATTNTPDILFGEVLPLAVLPGATVQISVQLTSEDLGQISGAVRVELYDGETLAHADVEVRGTGVAPPAREDAFQQLGLAKADILFVVDDGPGLSQEQTYLRESVEAFASRTSRSVDAQFAVIATGRTNPLRADQLWPRGLPDAQIVSSSISMDLPADIGRLISAPGTTTSTLNEGLEAILQTLTGTASDASTRLLRPDAVLLIMVISASDDDSERSVAEYASRFLQIKGPRSSNLFSVSAIAGPPPDGCEHEGLVANPALRYAQLVGQTGGTLASICDREWPNRFVGSLISFGYKSRFFLSNQPRIASIEVIVSGEPLPSVDSQGRPSWIYDFATNSINFSPRANPEPGADLLVRYQVSCTLL